MKNLFISHSWNYTDAYERLCDLLDEAPYFKYKNYSVPKEEPLSIYSKQYYKSELRNKIMEQMKHASVVLILAGVYASYSESIDMEIEIAKELGKPIIAIEPWGAEKTSIQVKENANLTVKWNTSSIIDAIRELT
ncbi:MAG TPA: TIR domain-containing protein [Bacteroidales bacterium]|nr:TIR domain-containing protein [Bacteroidales bacterium]HQC59929.1 TIR domain-containing protein [Bacteroidales bacterium]